MSDSGQTNVSNIGVAMFTIADQGAAIAYYTQKLGWELRADIPFGDEGGHRWVEVAPPGSSARLALNPPMGEWAPGGSAVGVESADVDAERSRLAALGDVKVGETMGGEGPVPKMFSVEDPDGTTSGSCSAPDGRRDGQPDRRSRSRRRTAAASAAWARAARPSRPAPGISSVLSARRSGQQRLTMSLSGSAQESADCSSGRAWKVDAARLTSSTPGANFASDSS
jgi:hypothetical protein